MNNTNSKNIVFELYTDGDGVEHPRHVMLEVTPEMEAKMRKAAEAVTELGVASVNLCGFEGVDWDGFNDFDIEAGRFDEATPYGEAHRVDEAHLLVDGRMFNLRANQRDTDQTLFTTYCDLKALEVIKPGETVTFPVVSDRVARSAA